MAYVSPIVQNSLSNDIQTISFQLLVTVSSSRVYDDLVSLDSSSRGAISYTTLETSATRSGLDSELATSQTLFPSATSTGTLATSPIAVPKSSVGLSTGAIFGIGLGGALACLLVLNVTFLLFRRRRRPVASMQKEPEAQQKAELDDNARCHEMDGGSHSHWWNRWHSSFRPTMGDLPQELSDTVRAELPEDTVPQELGGEPSTWTFSNENENEIERNSSAQRSVPGTEHSLENQLLIIMDDALNDEVLGNEESRNGDPANVSTIVR